MPKIFAATDANIKMVIAGGFNVADIEDIIVTLKINTTTRTFKLSTGEITISGFDLIISVLANSIIQTGNYTVSVRLIDKTGKFRGITVTPDKLEFE